MGLLEKNMKSTQTGSKVFKQVSPHDGNEKKSFQVRVVLNFALAWRRAWDFFWQETRQSPGKPHTVGFCFFFRELTYCSGRKKVCQTNLVPEFGSRMSRFCATRRARSVRRTVDYLTAISRKQQGRQDCSGNTSLVPRAITFWRMSGSVRGHVAFTTILWKSMLKLSDLHTPPVSPCPLRGIFFFALSPPRCCAMANCLNGGSSSSALGNLTPSAPGIFNARSCLHLGRELKRPRKQEPKTFCGRHETSVHRIGANFLRMFQLIRTQWMRNPDGFTG